MCINSRGSGSAGTCGPAITSIQNGAGACADKPSWRLACTLCHCSSSFEHLHKQSLACFRTSSHIRTSNHAEKKGKHFQGGAPTLTQGDRQDCTHHHWLAPEGFQEYDLPIQDHCPGPVEHPTSNSPTTMQKSAHTSSSAAPVFPVQGPGNVSLCLRARGHDPDKGFLPLPKGVLEWACEAIGSHPQKKSSSDLKGTYIT